MSYSFYVFVNDKVEHVSMSSPWNCNVLFAPHADMRETHNSVVKNSERAADISDEEIAVLDEYEKKGILTYSVIRDQEYVHRFQQVPKRECSHTEYNQEIINVISKISIR